MTARPVIIEAALNGGCSKARNPNVPITPQEIIDDAARCIIAGATSIHNHIEDIKLTGQAAADRYLEAWGVIHAKHPDVLLCPTIALGGDVAERNAHVAALARSGMVRLAPLDPGAVNFPSRGGGMPGGGAMVYAHGYDDADHIVDLIDGEELAASVSVYDASFLRATLHYRSLGRLRRGVLLKLYFGGDYNLIDGTRGALTFGFRPTRKALEAYLEMLGDADIPWLVNVYGGDVVASGLAEIALDMGGHVRVGLEDYAGDGTPSNAELIDKVTELALRAGRPIATPAQAAALIGLAA